MGNVIIANDPYYIEVLRMYYEGGDSLSSLSDYEAAIWSQFCAIHNIDEDATPSSSDLQQAFRTFVSQFNGWGFPLAVITSTNTLPSNGEKYDFFNTYLNAFYGNYTDIEKNDIWNSFLYNQGLVAADGTIIPPTNPHVLLRLQKPFAQFINSLSQRENLAGEVVGISPQEGEQRAVLTSIMGALSSMLNSTQGLITTQSYSLIYLSKMQQEYTTMLTRVPTLVSVEDPTTSPSTTVQLPTGDDPTLWDLSTFTFGYDKISLQEVIDWGIDQAMNGKKSVKFGLNQNPNQMGSYRFTPTLDSEGNVTEITLSFSYGGDSTDYSTTIPLVDQDGKLLIIPADPTSGTTAHTIGYMDVISQSYTGFKQIFAGLPDLDGFLKSYRPPHYKIGLTGRFLSPDSESKAFEGRIEQNAVLEQYAQNIKARRDLLQTDMKKLQSVLSNGRQSIDEISQLWTTILETIQSIISSIFKQT